MSDSIILHKTMIAVKGPPDHIHIEPRNGAVFLNWGDKDIRGIEGLTLSFDDIDVCLDVLIETARELEKRAVSESQGHEDAGSCAANLTASKKPERPAVHPAFQGLVNGLCPREGG